MSGKDFFAEYPNGDKIYSPNIIFISEDFQEILNQIL